MSVLQEGWIEKKGQTFGSTTFGAGYRKRWLVLYSDRTVKYYQDTNYGILKGSIDISEATKAQNSNEHSKQWKFGWNIVTPSRKWQFSSKTAIDRDDWVRNINTSINSISPKSIPFSANRTKTLKDIAKRTSIDTETETLISTEKSYKSKPKITSDSDDESEDVFGNEATANKESLDLQINATKINTTLNKQKSVKSPQLSPPVTAGNPTSHFGKDLNRMTTRSMAEMVNNCLSLSVQSQQKSQNAENETDAYAESFQWDQYNGKILECIQRDKTSANDMVRMDELTCFCGGNIIKMTCDCDESKVICEFCGMHKVSKGAEYFACDNKESVYHANNVWCVCSCCCFNQLVKKYYDPLSECKSKIIPRKVGISIYIERVSTIDTANQSFRAKVCIKHSWKPTKEEVQLFKERPSDFMPFWMPRFEFPTCIETHDGGLKQSHWNTDYTILEKGESNGDNINPLPYLICGELWIDATFSEVFELENFPVDCQDLTITIQSGHYASICEYNVPFEGQDILTISSEYSTIPEWYAYVIVV